MTKKSKAQTYVDTYLLPEKGIVETSGRANRVPELTIYEKTLIYKYTDDGYESLNKTLRNNKGLHKNEYGLLLERCLKKLPDYTDLAYRTANLSANQLNMYTEAFIKGIPIKEKCFISASKKSTIAFMFNGNTFFTILSKTGKDIEGIAKFGIDDGQNESEILFIPNRKFSILDVTKNMQRTLITMEEVI